MSRCDIYSLLKSWLLRRRPSPWTLCRSDSSLETSLSGSLDRFTTDIHSSSSETRARPGFRSSPRATTGNSTSTGSASYTYNRSSNGASDRSPLSLAETGYDLCPSSDLSDLTRRTALTETVTSSPTQSLVSLTLSDVKSEKYATASQASTDFGTVAVASSRLSTRFDSLPSVSSNYGTAHSVSSYRTAGSELSRPSIYTTVDEVEDDLPEIPSESQLNTPTLSLVSLAAASEAYVPSEIPTISSPSVHSELLPEEIPLPWSVSSPLSRLSPQSSHSRRSSVATSQPRWRPLPVPPTSTSSYSLSPAPTQLTPSSEGRHVVTPTSLKISSSTVSSLPSEETTRLSRVPSLPPSASQSASVVTPTSLRGLSTPTTRSIPAPTSIPATRRTSTASSSFSITSSVSPLTVTQTSTPPSIPAIRRRSTTSSSSFSITSSVTPLTVTQTSSSFGPLIPQAWASVSDLSYDSSILQPSPSVHSVAIEEEIEDSFETSFLRPSASPSSGRSNARPPLVTPSRPQSLTSALTSIPALPPSISSLTDVRTPTTLGVPPVPRSPDRAFPRVPSVSLGTETLLTASLLEAEPDIAVFEEASEQVYAPSTQPSTISIIEPPPRRSPSPSPSPGPSSGPGPSSAAPPSLPTPAVSIVVSVTTPQGSGATEQSSLRTRPSIHVAERDLADDFSRLADEVHTLNQVRGLEHHELVTDLGALREEVQGVANFVRSTAAPAPPTPRAPSLIIPITEEEPRQREFIDRPVGGSSVISTPSGLPRVVEVAVPAPITSPGYSTSHSEDLQSYVSSYHSDDDILQDFPMLSPPVREQLGTRFPSSGSSSLSSSPYASSSELAPEAPDIVINQIPNIVEQALEEIRVQLQALQNDQATNLGLLGSLQRQSEDHVPELVERLQRIEGLLQTYLDQGYPRGPEIIHPRPPPTPPAESIAESTGSIRRLRSLLNDLVSQVETQKRPTPVPVSAPSRTEQLRPPQHFDEYFLPTPITPTRSEIPEIEPFVYHPVGRGSRARSASPVSVDRLPPPTQPVQLSYPIDTQMQITRRRRRRPVTREPPAALPTRPVTPEVERILSQRRIRRDVARQPPPQLTPAQRPQRPQLLLPPSGEALRRRQSTAEKPVSPTGLDRAKSVSVTVDIPQQQRPLTSWYRPREEVPQEQRTLATAPPATEHPRVSYIPMPDTTVVQFPRLDSSMAVLRENRLAQLATVDQQRELMRHMRGLNDWLERDVHNRHREIRRVNATVEDLTRDIRSLQRRSRRDSVRSSRRRRPASGQKETTIRLDLPASSAPRMPSFPAVPPVVQPVPVERRAIPSSVPLQRHPTMFYPVVPHSRQSQPAIVFLPAVQTTHRRHAQPNMTERHPRRRP